MFCKNCGQQISDNSRYCIHCGTLQKNSHTHINQQHFVNQQLIKKFENIIGINNSKKVVGFYLIWFLIHLILLLLNWNTNNYANERFWPFSAPFELEYYDFSEFILYTIVPIILLVIVNLFLDTKESKAETVNLKYDLTHEKDTTASFIGVSIIIIFLAFYIISSNYDSVDIQKAQQSRMFLSVVSIIMRIGITVWVVHIAKKLNRDTAGWGFFAFILPSITLIVIGQKRKLKKQIN
jgi:hypothetical protein